jgi:phage/conjugal plasmid C-4 type zinc finger TraR family protein
VDDADRAQAQAEWMEQFRIQHKRKHVMRASDFCVDCHEEIEAQRLKALPTAQRCVYCQNEHERLQSQYG